MLDVTPRSDKDGVPTRGRVERCLNGRVVCRHVDCGAEHVAHGTESCNGEIQQQVDAGFNNLYGEGPTLFEKQAEAVAQQEVEILPVQTETEVVGQQEAASQEIQTEIEVVEEEVKAPETPAPTEEIKTEVKPIEVTA